MKKIIAISILSALMLNSCISVQFANLDMQAPAKVTFPKDVVNIAIVNNTLLSPRIEGDSLVQTNTIPILADSICNAFIDSLAKQLDSQKYFGQVISYPYNTRTDYDFNKIHKLTPEKVQEICKEMQVEALVSVDFFQVGGHLKPIYYDLDAENAELSLGTSILLHTYKVNGNRIQQPILYSDTLYWQGLASRYRGIIPDEYFLPTSDKAISSLMDYAAQEITKLYIPSWRTEERVYFANGSKLMNKASEKVGANKWQEAVNFWEEAYKEEKNENKRARIAYNLALGYETLDNIDKSITWIKVAKELSPSVSQAEISSQIDWYYNTLTQRKLEVDLLKIQLGSDSKQE